MEKQEQQKQRFPVSAYIYVWVFLGIYCLSPLWISILMVRPDTLTITAGIECVIASLTMATLLLHANLHCKSEQMTYLDGLLYVATSMMSGWIYFEVFFVFPALLFTCLASVFLSLFYIGKAHAIHAARAFHAIVFFFYRHRMIQ